MNAVGGRHGRNLASKGNTMTHRTFTTTSLALVAAAALAACSSVPERNLALDQARARFEAAQAQPQVASSAAAELQRASDALRVADQARASGETLATVDHLAYLARQRVVIAEETAISRGAQAVTAGAQAERDRVRLAMRTQEADAAQMRLSSSEQANAQKSQELAMAEQANARKSQELAMAEKESARKTAELAQADAAAQAERVRLAQRDARVADLEAQMREINARQTERGIVVTLGDLLFNTGDSRLQSEGLRSMSKLADFLKRNPERRAAIEGYTDSVGSSASNQQLSERRAIAVMDALVQQGISASRLTTMAYGEDRPVGDNNTVLGRQMNRRVEVVFAAQAGDVMLK